MEQRKTLTGCLNPGAGTFSQPQKPVSIKFNLYVSRCRFLLIHPQDSWEILEGLRAGVSPVLEPPKHEGYMLKRRKWPMKGWHKVHGNTLRGEVANIVFRQSILLTRVVMSFNLIE